MIFKNINNKLDLLQLISQWKTLSKLNLKNKYEVLPTLSIYTVIKSFK